MAGAESFRKRIGDHDMNAQNTANDRITVHGLGIDKALHGFIENEALPGSGIAPDAFWSGLAALIHDFGPRNRELLDKRAAMQKQIDDWHRARRGQPFDLPAYKAFLAEIGYLVPEGPDFTVETQNVDPEIADIAGPQLVVPVMNARYALNAANARWGSLYDALYGTDAMGDLPQGSGYDPARGARVIAWARKFLDDSFPLTAGSHADAREYRIAEGALVVAMADGTTAGLKDPAQFAGHVGMRVRPKACFCAITGCMRKSSSIASTPSARQTRRASRMCSWKPPSRRSWIARIPSPPSMRRTRSWPIATGSA